MKFNSNKNMYKGKMYKYPIHKVVNCEIKAEYDQEFPKEFPNVINKSISFCRLN